jgi:glutamate-1-semialdehyde 2,1-aminomutase
MYGHESTVLLPDAFPQFFQRAKGPRLWDSDGNEYVDLMCAYGPNLLGYGFEPVERAAAAQQARGDSMTGPSEIMVELAETFVEMITHASWAMFCKNGTDATTMAVVAARAQTGRRKILCASGAYHAAAPWCTPRAGILAEDRAHIVYYEPEDPESLEAALRANAGDVAAVFVTPFIHEVFRDGTVPSREFAARARRQLLLRLGYRTAVVFLRVHLSVSDRGRDCPRRKRWARCCCRLLVDIGSGRLADARRLHD